MKFTFEFSLLGGIIHLRFPFEVAWNGWGGLGCEGANLETPQMVLHRACRIGVMDSTVEGRVCRSIETPAALAARIHPSMVGLEGLEITRRR